MRYSFIPLLLLFSFEINAQYNYVEYTDTPIVNSNQEELAFPWAGGLNGVQYGKMDLNGDGTDDLVGFDRSSNRLLCFLRLGDQYEYAPQYEKFFPSNIQNFFILRDFDGDGRADIFTAGNLGITAFKNIGSITLPAWERVLDFISYESFSGNEVNLQINVNDYPYIGDVDEDGDIDILNFNFSGIESRILFYENQSIEQGAQAALGPFVLKDNYWGQVEDCDCGVFAFNAESCDQLFASLARKEQHAGGKSVAIHDFKSDGILDLVTSHEECSELYYFNNSAASEQSPDFNSFTSNFPNEDNPARFNFYPNVMIMDLLGDEEEELIISPNVKANLGSRIDFYSSNWLYRRNGENFELITKRFLQEEMIDWGFQASPSFFDFDGDGDLDLFMAYTDLNEEEQLYSAITLYENVGSAGNPDFVFITDDYLEISDQNLANLFIQWIDIDLDSRLDLVLQATIENENVLQVIFQEQAGFDLNNRSIIDDVFIGFGYTVHFANVVGDANPDLLVCKSSGGLLLYENTGTGRSPSFQLQSGDYLNIGDDFFRSALRVFVGDVDADSKQDLVTSDLSGNIRVFSDLENNQGESDSIRIYNSLEQSFENLYFGERNNITFAKIFDDEFPSLITGTISGGLRMFRNTQEFPVQNEGEYVFQIYPNPNLSKRLFVKTNQNISISISSLSGQLLMPSIPVEAFSTDFIDLNDFQNGVYIVTASFAGGVQKSRKLLLY